MNKLIKDEKLGVVIFVEQVSPQLQTLHCEGEDKKAWSCIQKKIYVPQIDATFLKKPFSKSNKQYTTYSHCLKITQNVAIEFLNFGIFPPKICPIKTDLSGNTVWLQASGFQKLSKMDHFWHFW